MRQRPPISLFASFRAAFRGFGDAVAEQRNLRIHLTVSLGVFIWGILLEISLTNWLLLALCIGSVVSLELMNTAVETAVDLASPTEHELARKAKDISAAAVLIGSMAAAAVGAVILVLPLIPR
jgi:diacylglycerol kinase